jgi:hypothetical protein
MMDFVGLGCFGILFLILLYVKFKPIVTKEEHIIIVSYVVRDRFNEVLYRDFVVFDLRRFRFIKASL